MRATFRAFRSYNYRLFFVGQVLSLIGSWMDSLAMSWLVYRLTGSEILLGTVGFCSQIPMFLMSPYAGIVSDRIDRRRILLTTQSLSAVQAMVLAILVLTGSIKVWHIIVLSIFVGLVNAFDNPARQALVPDLVEDRTDLSNAIALNSTQFNIARLIGPAVGGFTIAAVGEGWCFFINAISFLAVIGALAMMRLKRHEAPKSTVGPIAQIREGAVYVWKLHPIRILLMLMATASLVAGAYGVLLPVYAKDVYHGNSETLGWMYAAVGVGALVAATMLASRRSVVGLGRWVVIASMVFGISLAAFGFTRSMWTGLPVLAVLGFGMMKHFGSTNTLIQTIVEDRMRGRVMAFYMMAFVGTMPIGSLLGGLLSAQIGPAYTLLLGGLIALGGSVSFYRSLPEFRRILRPIYEKKGILSPV